MRSENKQKNQKTAKDESIFLSAEKKKIILGLLMCLISVLIALSIFSYSGYDKANLKYQFSDLFTVFSDNPDVLQRIDSTNNWLGILGAYISDILINSTIGYFSIIFPVILFIWGYAVLKNDFYKSAGYTSNALVAAGILFASFFGVLQADLNILYDYPELSGKVGLFFGSGLSRLLGELGGLILLAFLMFIEVFLVFDIKIEKIFAAISGFFKDDETKEDNKELKAQTNLEKIKKLRVSEEIKTEQTDAAEESEEKKETTIRIINKNKEDRITEEEPARENYDDKQILSKTEENTEMSVERKFEADAPEQWEEEINFTPPGLTLFDNEDGQIEIPEIELKKNAALLKEKLSLFDIEIEDISVTPGPVVTLYEIVPAPGVKISRIVSLENDIALALAARGIRIIAPIPGKSAIGVEIPNAVPSLVSARSVISKIKDSKKELPLALGKTISGEVYITDLASMPHLLIAGSTGSGKSVGINMIITSLLYAKHPSEIKFAIIDPKKIELSFYQKLSRHYLAVSPDLDEEIITNPQNALLLLKAVEYEMEKRYDKLAKAGVRNIVDYNEKILNPRKRPADTETMKHFKMPYIVVVIDELADLMMTSGKEVEEPIARLAQLARAVGIHLIVATQRPSVNVITGVIKANFSARVAYQTATRIDSRTILDMKGAEQLLGRGDMLFLPGGSPKPIRIQNAFISTDEVEKITNFIHTQKGYSRRYFLPSLVEKKTADGSSGLSDIDPMFEEAARVIVRHQQGSVSLLQRKLKLGYSRAARIVDQLEEAGVVGPAEGSKAREVICENEEQLETILRSL
ncbi:MAG: DNA translocase FtsK [Ignavibacteria bacterium]|nr:DNA translocase FtsK [Ignavibacteria bacterium]